MSETEVKTQAQKPETCILAILAPTVIVLGYAMLVLLELFLGVVRGVSLAVGLSIFGLSALGGFVLGIVAIVKIKRSSGKLVGRVSATLGIVLAVVSFNLCLSVAGVGHEGARRVICHANLQVLGQAMQAYTNDYDGQYPTANKWCDLLVQNTDMEKRQFVNSFLCRGALRGGDEERCHYAINPNCEPNSPGDVVLLFETKGGWNQSGGPEILTFENHKGEGCNILFNDGHVEFVKPKQLGELKWE